MIFIDDGKEIVGIVENAVPFTTSSAGGAPPFRYVLEVNAGFAAAHGLEGQRGASSVVGHAERIWHRRVRHTGQRYETEKAGQQAVRPLALRGQPD
jgi:hypothetical protein